MDKIKELETERTQIMGGMKTHMQWVKDMERLAEISAEILLISHPIVEGLKEDGKMPEGKPPLSTHEQRMEAKRKLIELNQFKEKRIYAAI